MLSNPLASSSLTKREVCRCFKSCSPCILIYSICWLLFAQNHVQNRSPMHVTLKLGINIALKLQFLCFAFFSWQIDFSSNDDTKEVSSLEHFMEKIRHHMIEQCVYSRANKHIIFAAEEIPPIIPPAFRGPVVFNTEMDKKSEFLKGSQTPEGRSGISFYSICSTMDHVLSVHSLMETNLQCTEC